MREVTLCKATQLDQLQEFIDCKWRKNHILAKDKKILDFQHKSNGIYNFFISRNTQGDINGVLGFIPTSQFDNKLIDNSDYWLALWKSDEGAPAGTGFALLRQLEKCFTPKSIGIVGINSTVRKIYQTLGYNTGIMNHYYIANPTITKSLIGKNLLLLPKSSNYHFPESKLKEITLQDIKNLKTDYYPQKSIAYIKNRYVKHPYYKYMLYGVYNEDVLGSVIVARTVSVENNLSMRIIDIIGEVNKIHFIGNDLLNIMKKYNVEYVDCLNYGISSETFENWGFIKKSGDTIIPNYFEPYVCNNVELLFAYKTSMQDYVIFKGDGDQDRPNIL